MRIDLRQMRYFQAVAEELNFSRAAERVFISQPALSHQIAEIEEVLGVRLLERTKRRVALTPAGRRLLDLARQLQASMDEGLREVRRIGGAETSILRVGLLFNEYEHDGPVAEALRRFRQQNPKVSLELYEVLTGPMTQMLKEDALEIGFTHAPIDDEALLARPVGQEQFMVGLSETHPLAKHSTIPLSALSKQTILFPPREAVPDKYDELMGYCRRAGFEPKLKKAPGNLQETLEVVAKGRAICLTPTFTIRRNQPSAVVFRPLSSPAVILNLVAVYPAQNPSPLAESLLASQVL